MSDVLVENALVRAPWANEKVCGTISAYLVRFLYAIGIIARNVIA